MRNEELALTEKDIQEARDMFRAFLEAIAATHDKAKYYETREIDHQETHFTIKYKDGTRVRGKDSLEIKTVFHAVEVKIEDGYGGILSCTYNVRNTIEGLYKWVLDKYPEVTIDELQEYADEQQISFDEAKKKMAFIIAEKEYWIRLKMARFLHEQLEPAMKIMLSDLVDDAGLYGLSEYGDKLDSAKDFDRAVKPYLQLRKKRINVIRRVGERGKALLSAVEVSAFKEKVLASMAELERAGKKLNPHAVARKVITDSHSNPLKAFKDKLKKCGYTFEELKQEYSAKSELKNR